MISFAKTGTHLTFHRLVATIAIAATVKEAHVVPKIALLASSGAYAAIEFNLYRNGTLMGVIARITTEPVNQAGSGDWVVDEPIRMGLYDWTDFQPGDQIFADIGKDGTPGRQIGSMVFQLETE